MPTAVDSNTAFTLAFCPPDGSDTGLSTLAVLSCSITLSALNPGVIIRFEHGNIVIAAPIYCPKAFTVQHFGREAGSRGTVVKEETRRFEYVGGGWHWQADEVARCVREGRKQSLVWGHLKSLLEMQILDDVRSIWQAAERVKQEQLEGGEQKMKPEQKRKFNPIEDGRTAREEGRQPVASGHDKDKVVAVEQSDGIEQLLELPQRPLKRKEREETGTRLRPAKGKVSVRPVILFWY